MARYASLVTPSTVLVVSAVAAIEGTSVRWMVYELRARNDALFAAMSKIVRVKSLVAETVLMA